MNRKNVIAGVLLVLASSMALANDEDECDIDRELLYHNLYDEVNEKFPESKESQAIRAIVTTSFAPMNSYHFGNYQIRPPLSDSIEDFPEQLEHLSLGNFENILLFPNESIVIKSQAETNKEGEAVNSDKIFVNGKAFSFKVRNTKDSKVVETYLDGVRVSNKTDELPATPYQVLEFMSASSSLFLDLTAIRTKEYVEKMDLLRVAEPFMPEIKFTFSKSGKRTAHFKDIPISVDYKNCAYNFKLNGKPANEYLLNFDKYYKSKHKG